MDHHCYWLHKCVGANNHVEFFFFHALHVYLQYNYLTYLKNYLILSHNEVIMATLSQQTISNLDDFQLSSTGGQAEGLLSMDMWLLRILYDTAQEHPGIGGVTFFHILLCTFLFNMFIVATGSLLWNITTNELLKIKVRIVLDDHANECTACCYHYFCLVVSLLYFLWIAFLFSAHMYLNVCCFSRKQCCR